MSRHPSTSTSRSSSSSSRSGLYNSRTRSEPNIRLPRDAYAARKVVKILSDQGYQVWLVGGAIRDHFLQRRPSDYDIVTDAPLTIIQQLLIAAEFPNVSVSWSNALILQHRNQQVDISTLYNPNKTAISIWDLRNDAAQRDFTINAMYWDCQGKKLHGFHNGRSDLEKRILKIIGDPQTRFHDDPLLILRAIKLCHLGFTMEPATAVALQANIGRLATVPQYSLHRALLRLKDSLGEDDYTNALKTYGIEAVLDISDTSNNNSTSTNYSSNAASP